MLMNDTWIREQGCAMLEPFAEKLKQEGVISYGVSSFGYDLRAAPEWLIFDSIGETIVDPKAMRDGNLRASNAESIIIPPNSFALTRSLEYIRMPDDVLALAVGKSTYARVGIVANTTPLEPGWEGHLTIELSNTTPLPARVYANEGIVQLLFFKGQRPEQSYADRGGKYQYQRGITLAKMHGQ